MYSNTSGNVLKIANVKMIKKPHESTVGYIVTFMVACGNPWYLVLKKHN